MCESFVCNPDGFVVVVVVFCQHSTSMAIIIMVLVFLQTRQASRTMEVAIVHKMSIGKEGRDQVGHLL